MNEQTVLFDLLKEGVSTAHVVKSCEKRLEDAGYEKIAYEKRKNLQCALQRHIRIFRVCALSRPVMS